MERRSILAMVGALPFAPASKNQPIAHVRVVSERGFNWLVDDDQVKCYIRYSDGSWSPWRTVKNEPAR